MKDTAIFALKHQPSSSLFFLQIEKVNGVVKITDCRFSKGNVVSLLSVRQSLETARKQFFPIQRSPDVSPH